MGDRLAGSWFGTEAALARLARYQSDQPQARRGPRIGRPGKVVSRVTGPVAEGVVLSTELDPFLSLKALAGYSGISVRKLREHLTDAAHPLPHYRIGGKIVVRRSDYDAWAAQYRQVGDADLDRVVSKVLRDLRGAA